MGKKYSMRRRIWQAVIEIIIGTCLLILLLLGLTFFLRQIGQISGSETIRLSLDSDNLTISDIEHDMKHYPYDYIIFDNETSKILGGHYVKSDVPSFVASKQSSHNITEGEITYTYSSNKHFSVVLRQNSMPEFTNHTLRSISYNQFTYLFFFLGEIILIIFSVYHLIREFSKNFQAVQKIALKMGEITTFPEQEESKIIEFDQVLNNLYSKSKELAFLIEAERHEKHDLSFQVAALSHDVKTPLTVLKGNIELLEMTEVNEQQADFIESMKNSLTVFDKYFNTMISYTKLLNDENDYKARISLEDFLIDLSFELEELSTTYQVDYQLVKKTDLTTFYGNTLALSRALINIFVNACQYAKEGEKIVSLSIYDDEKYLYFEIWNNGHPFSEQAKKNAGKLFFTEDTGRSGKHYGIGLSFTQGVALNHQGNLILSNPQKGGAEVILKIKK